MLRTELATDTLLRRVAALWDPRLVRFCAVGLLGYVVNSAVLLLAFKGLHLPLTLASALAVEVAILNNFLWNNIWTFRGGGWRLDRLAKFHLISLGGLLISVSMLSLLVCGTVSATCDPDPHPSSLYLLAANLGASATATLWNFFLNRKLTWRA